MSVGYTPWSGTPVHSVARNYLRGRIDVEKIIKTGRSPGTDYVSTTALLLFCRTLESPKSLLSKRG